MSGHGSPLHVISHHYEKLNIYLDGLAIDWLTNKLYWSEATPETISVLDLERGHRLTLFSLPESSVPRGIALDPVNG